MSNPPPPRPPLKLRLSTPSIASVADTPISTPKIKLKLGNPSKSSTPAQTPDGEAKKDKKPRKPREKKEKVATEAKDTSPQASKKRANPEPGDEESQAITLPSSQKPMIKKLKLTASRTPITPIIRPKFKGKPPHRPLGVGYDSESSDRENDPAIEEEFILRMVPGEDCEYLRKAIEEKRIGIPIRDGGADVWMKFFSREGRRAAICIRGRMYAGAMVDLPCIVEGMKSWDRKGWWKSADICQMLLVTGPVANEQMAHTAPLPSIVDAKTFQYPHGLTPPMNFARKRRFRKRISNRTIEAVEDEVERLLEADQVCEPGSSRYEILDLDRLTRDNSIARDSDGEGGFDMLGNAGMAGRQGEYEGFAEQDGYFDGVDDGLEADLEMAMMEDDEVMPGAEDASVATNPDGTMQANITAANGSDSLPTPSAAAEDSGDDSEEEEDEEELDDEALELQQDRQRQREEITDLEEGIRDKTNELEKLTNPLLRAKVLKMIASLKSDLELKRGALGEDEAD
jgi:transcription initiation factor TFIID subunit 7